MEDRGEVDKVFPVGESDILKAPHYPHTVGGRLEHFLRVWMPWCQDQWVIDILQRGYRIEFREIPRFQGIRITPIPRNSEKRRSLLGEVEDLLAKSAVREVTEKFQEGFYSTIFLAPKKNGKWRPVINLRPLNYYIMKSKFKMTTLRQIIQEVRPGDWMLSVDLKDAYFHVPVCREHWKFLRFRVGSRTFEFTVLPFGITSAPRVFTKVMAPLTEQIRRTMGLFNCAFLDDFLGKDQDKSFLVCKSRTMVQFMVEMGLVINLEKSELEPSQDLTYIGARFLTRIGIVTIPEDRIVAIKQIAAAIRRAERIVVRQFLRLLGLLNSCIFQVKWGRLYTRPLQLYLQAWWRPSTGDINDKIPILQSVKEHIRWWEEEENLRNGISLSPQIPQQVLVTDASKMGWGAYLESGGETNGVWLETEKSRHINWLEMRAVFNALIYFQERIAHQTIKVNKQARGDAFDQPMLFSMGDAELVQGSSSHSAGGIHSGENECSGGSVFASRIASRMVPMPGGGERNFSDMGDPVHRSVRQFTHKEATNILFEGEGSNGVCDGQHVDQLEGSGGICISTGAIDSAGATEGQTGRVQNDFNSTELGETTVDVSTNRSVGGRTKKTSSEEKAPKASGTAEVSPRSRNVKLIYMEDKRSELRKKGFREESAKLATSDIRSTTCKTYGYKIQKYIDWCNQERIKHPRSSSVASVCNFLTDMFGKGASAHAISGYISALSKWHRKVHGKYLCEIEELRNIRKATAIQRPPKKVRFETWNLSLVLQNLTREPFEPMISAPMKFVSYKTVFLVAAATARRCSEIGALSMDAENFIERPRHIEIGYMPNFIPKNA